MMSRLPAILILFGSGLVIGLQSLSSRSQPAVAIDTNPKDTCPTPIIASHRDANANAEEAIAAARLWLKTEFARFEFHRQFEELKSAHNKLSSERKRFDRLMAEYRPGAVVVCDTSWYDWAGRLPKRVQLATSTEEIQPLTIEVSRLVDGVNRETIEKRESLRKLQELVDHEQATASSNEKTELVHQDNSNGNEDERARKSQGNLLTIANGINVVIYQDGYPVWSGESNDFADVFGQRNKLHSQIGTQLKPVHVSDYYRKNGTHVHAHNRALPNTAPSRKR